MILFSSIIFCLFLEYFRISSGSQTWVNQWRITKSMSKMNTIILKLYKNMGWKSYTHFFVMVSGILSIFRRWKTSKVFWFSHKTIKAESLNEHRKENHLHMGQNFNWISCTLMTVVVCEIRRKFRKWGNFKLLWISYKKSNEVYEQRENKHLTMGKN